MLPAVLIALLLAAPAAAAAPPDPAALTREAFRAIDARDGAAIRRIFCPEALSIARGNVLRTAEQLAEGAGTGSPARQALRRTWDRLSVRRIAGATIVTGETKVSGRYGSADNFVTAVFQPASRGGLCLALLQRAPGGLAAEGSRWDEAFQISDTINRSPNRWLEQAIDGIRPGRALDVGMGQGRNAIALAQKGWDVTGFDVSGEGLRLAREAADAQGLTIETVFAADTDFYFGQDQWDLIAFIYVGTRGFEPKAFGGLKPGGIVVAEAFGAAADPSRRGDAVFHAPGEMRDRFKAAGFEIVRYEEPVAVADYGGAKVPLVRLIARKPAR